MHVACKSFYPNCPALSNSVAGPFFFPWKKGDPLQESGLLGPVTLYQTLRFQP